MPPRPRIGDLYEMWTPCGLAYLQYTHEDARMGSLAHVLAGLHPERPKDVPALASTHRFFVFVPIAPAARAGDLTLVGHAEVPTEFQRLPVFRHELGGDGSRYGWILRDGDREVGKRKPLSATEQSIPGYEIWTYGLLVDRVGSGWSWAHDVGPIPRPDE